MKQSIRLISAIVMVLFLSNGAGAVTWDLGTGFLFPNATANFAIPGALNGGEIIIDPFQGVSDYPSGNSKSVVNATPPPFATISDEVRWDGPNGNFLQMNATAGGGILPNGATVNGSLAISYTLNNNGIEGLYGGRQNTTATIQRSFRPEIGEFTLSAGFLGSVNWPSFGNPSADDLYNTYMLTGFITAQQYTVVSKSHVGTDLIINLNNSKWSDSIKGLHTSDDYFWVLTAQITLDTYLQNAEFPFRTGNLNPGAADPTSGTHSIGSSPFYLNAEVVSAVPIPGSLVLLVSGIAGLVAIKRRKAA